MCMWDRPLLWKDCSIDYKNRMKEIGLNKRLYEEDHRRRLDIAYCRCDKCVMHTCEDGKCVNCDRKKGSK